MRYKSRLIAIVCGAVLACGSYAGAASAHWAPKVKHHNTRHAINLVWCGSSNNYCGSSHEAWSVVRCETGGTFSVWARNSNPPAGDQGDYLGLFQMGDYARNTFGHAWNPWGQARAAHRYYRESGWHPWECAFIIGIL